MLHSSIYSVSAFCHEVPYIVKIDNYDVIHLGCHDDSGVAFARTRKRPHTGWTTVDFTARFGGKVHGLWLIAARHSWKGPPIMPVDLAKTCIDHHADHYRHLLENLQGNILKGHGRNFEVHIFRHFTAAPQDVQAWLRDVAAPYVTSAGLQLKEADAFRTHGVPGRLFGNLFLSAKGYEALGHSTEDIAHRFAEAPAVLAE
jgi:hypothetical protein